MLLNLMDDHPELLVYPTDLNMLYAYFPQYTSESHSVQQYKDRLKTILFHDFNDLFTKEDIDNYLNVELFEEEFFSSFDDEKMTEVIDKLNKNKYKYQL